MFQVTLQNADAKRWDSDHAYRAARMADVRKDAEERTEVGEIIHPENGRMFTYIPRALRVPVQS